MDALLILALSLMIFGLLTVAVAFAMRQVSAPAKKGGKELLTRLNPDEDDVDEDEDGELSRISIDLSRIEAFVELPENGEEDGIKVDHKIHLVVGEATSMDDLLRMAAAAVAESAPDATPSAELLRSMRISYETNSGELRQVREGASWLYASQVLGNAQKIFLTLPTPEVRKGGWAAAALAPSHFPRQR